MKLNSKIVEARWDESEGIWNLTIENPKTKEQRKEWAHVFVNGSGTCIPNRFVIPSHHLQVS
jgi:hypothetical protein